MSNKKPLIEGKYRSQGGSKARKGQPELRPIKPPPSQIAFAQRKRTLVVLQKEEDKSRDFFSLDNPSHEFEFYYDVKDIPERGKYECILLLMDDLTEADKAEVLSKLVEAQ